MQRTCGVVYDGNEGSIGIEGASGQELHWRIVISTEIQYLVRLIRSWLTDPAAGSTQPVSRGVSGDEVRRLLAAHRIEAALAGCLAPELLTPAFDQLVRSSRERTDFLLMELERVLPVLEVGDCRPVVLKGAALAQACYRVPHHRWFMDLDLLVPRERVEETCRRLEGLGYRPFTGGRDPLFYEKHHLHRIMMGPQGSCLEVHWALTLPASVYSFDLAGVFERAREAPLGRRHMWVTSPVDQVLHNVYQAIADGFVDLRRILDLALLTADLSDDDWLYLMKQSRQTGMSSALWLSLHLMKEVTGRTPDLAIMDALAPRGPVKRILKGMDVSTGCLERRAESVDGYSVLLHLLLTPGPMNRLRESLRFVWPGEASLMDRGFAHHQLPGVLSRLRIVFYHLKLLTRISFRTMTALARG